MSQNIAIATDLLDWPPSDASIIVWASLATLVLAVAAVAKWGRERVHALSRALIRRFRAPVPRDTMRVVPEVGSLQWYEGSVSGEPATQVSGTWLVTNVLTEDHRDIVLVGVMLRLPWRLWLRADRGDSQMDVRVNQGIPWGATRQVHGLFWLVPSLSKTAKELRARVVFVDQFGNRRKVKCRFKPPRKAVVAPAPERERLSSIADPIEKQVASVLQSELGRYRTNGRREGGLGSVDATYQGHPVQLGGDFRETGTARNQIIVPDPERATIASDNADALERLYEGLVDDDERERFKRSLLSRISRDSAYAPVAYLPLMVALELDFAPSVFERARASLLGDRDYGFSNCLMLLNGLLRLRHENLPDELLDDIEDFIDGTGEHPFAIPERIATIRAHRLAASSGHS